MRIRWTSRLKPPALRRSHKQQIDGNSPKATVAPQETVKAVSAMYEKPNAKYSTGLSHYIQTNLS